MANDRDCENCIHKVNGACNVWECKFEPKRGMTKEEAIEIIECGEISNRWGKDGEEVEGMAIEALKQEPCEDAISRREAISIASIATLSVNQVVTALEKLPPVNPQKPICPSAGIDCEDCPAYEPKTGHSFPEGATNKDIFKAIFGYEPATDSVVCNKEDWCGASEPCNYCLNNSNSIGREEDWWNAPYKAEGSDKE